MSQARIGVAGLGLIGGSIAKRLAPTHAVKGFDLDGAERLGVEHAGSLEELASTSDLIFVAVPPKDTAACVTEVLTANPEARAADVASVKQAVTSEIPDDLLYRFLPCHPLAGAELSGWNAAREDLLDHAVWAVCPPRQDAPPELLAGFAPLFDDLQARLIFCNTKDHDLAVARTSHVPHLLAVALGASVNGSELTAALSGGAFHDLMRIARSDPELWRQILDLNAEAVREALDEVVERLGQPADWERAASGLHLTDELRWSEPDWQPYTFDWPAWDELTELGRRGVALRRITYADAKLSAEMTARA